MEVVRQPNALQGRPVEMLKVHSPAELWERWRGYQSNIKVMEPVNPPVPVATLLAALLDCRVPSLTGLKY
jgi:hypothetical protein